MAFEDEFTEKQKDMLALSLEYVKRLSSDVEKIYLYASHENSLYSFNILHKFQVFSFGQIFVIRHVSRICNK